MSNEFIVLRKDRVREITVTVILSAVIAAGAVITAASSAFIKAVPYSLFLAFVIPFAVMTATDILLNSKGIGTKIKSGVISAEALLFSAKLCYNYLCAIDGGFMGFTQISHIVIAVIAWHLVYLAVLLVLQLLLINRLVKKLK